MARSTNVTHKFMFCSTLSREVETKRKRIKAYQWLSHLRSTNPRHTFHAQDRGLLFRQSVEEVLILRRIDERDQMSSVLDERNLFHRRRPDFENDIAAERRRGGIYDIASSGDVLGIEELRLETGAGLDVNFEAAFDECCGGGGRQRHSLLIIENLFGNSDGKLGEGNALGRRLGRRCRRGITL